MENDEYIGDEPDFGELALLEELAALEHKQWRDWSHDIAGKEKISLDRKARWESLWCDYKELPEKMKELDRVWARKVLKILEKFNR